MREGIRRGGENRTLPLSSGLIARRYAGGEYARSAGHSLCEHKQLDQIPLPLACHFVQSYIHLLPRTAS